MNSKRKSTLGTIKSLQEPRRLTSFLKLLPEYDTCNGSSDNKRTNLKATQKQGKSSKRPIKPVIRGSAKKKTVNRVLCKRTASKSACSSIASKESPPWSVEALEKLVSRGRALRNSTGVTGGLRLMRERTARARAARILSTSDGENSVRKGMGLIQDNRTPSIQPSLEFGQLTPYNQLSQHQILNHSNSLITTNYKNEWPCSRDGDNIMLKSQYKSVVSESASCDVGSFQSSENKQTLLPLSGSKKPKLKEQMSTNKATISETEDKENFPSQEHQNAKNYLQLRHQNISDCGHQIEQNKNLATDVLNSSALSKKFKSVEFHHPSRIQNVFSAEHSKLVESATFSTPIKVTGLNHIPLLSSDHVKSPISSQSTSFPELLSSMKLQTSKSQKPNIIFSQNMSSMPSLITKSNLQKNSCEHINTCRSIIDNSAEAVTNGEATSTTKADIKTSHYGECASKELLIKKSIRNVLDLQKQFNTEIDLFVEKIKIIQEQQSEMLQKLVNIFNVTDESCKLNTSCGKNSEADSCADTNIERQHALELEPEKMFLVTNTPVASNKKQRRSSRIAAKMEGILDSASTPDFGNKSIAVTALYKDLQKSFTFLRTPRGCNTPNQDRAPARTPRTVISTSIQDQLLLLYDSLS